MMLDFHGFSANVKVVPIFYLFRFDKRIGFFKTEWLVGCFDLFNLLFELVNEDIIYQ